MKIAIGNDHAAPELKLAVIEHLKTKGIVCIDIGCAAGEKCDYPNAAKTVCEKVVSGECELGILICGTGIGMSMAANKVKGVRAALCHESHSAMLSRLHNNANVLCLGERITGESLALDIVDVWLKSEYEGGRHQKRVDMLDEE